jgi:hypothetical protein
VPPASAELEERVRSAYRLNPGDDRSAVCRLIPASLGGTNDPRNLFPLSPWFAELKARVDARLTERVQAGALFRADAIRALREDWILAAHTHGVRNYGSDDPREVQSWERALRAESRAKQPPDAGAVPGAQPAAARVN